jgi:D-sedoheptulose 7-phosphate isomerase
MPTNIHTIIDQLSDHPEEQAVLRDVAENHPEVSDILDDLLVRRPHLAALALPLMRLHAALVRCYDQGGTFFLCGNGGSYGDSLHIVGELLKSFERMRTLTAEQKAAFAGLPDGEVLANSLEQGLRGYALGNSGPLATAVQNDIDLRDIHFAQDLYAMARPGDVVMGISTSGNADNCSYALQVGKALGMTTVALTGSKVGGGKMGEIADILIMAEGSVTKLIQEDHFPTYHAMCAMIEAQYFPVKR